MKMTRLLPLTLALICSIAFATDSANDKQQQAARAASKQLLQLLGGALKKEMQTNGPVSAIKVCKNIAPAIAGKLSLQHGWRVTRVSENYRNSMLGMPDAFEAKTLATFASRKAAGEALKTMEASAMVEEQGKKYFRYMKAIGTKPICTTCHGDASTIPTGVKAALAAEYHMDRATGYKTGELRGAISIKMPLDMVE